MEKFMVFDVESIGLHGEGFAVAWVVVDRKGERLGEGCLSCDPDLCGGTGDSRKWVAKNVPYMEPTSPTKQHLRNTFWHEWRHWADQGAALVADCAWPVETNFLSACIALNHVEREWQGPYPLHDLASVLLALGGDALAVRVEALEAAIQTAYGYPWCAPQAQPAHPLPLVQATAPRNIWLQVSDDERDNAETFPDGFDGITWSRDSATVCGVPYVRADLAQAQPAPAQRLTGKLEYSACIHGCRSLRNPAPTA